MTPITGTPTWNPSESTASVFEAPPAFSGFAPGAGLFQTSAEVEENSFRLKEFPAQDTSPVEPELQVAGEASQTGVAEHHEGDIESTKTRIVDALRVLIRPGQTAELRACKVSIPGNKPDRRRLVTRIFTYDQIPVVAALATWLTLEGSEAVYLTLNEVHPDLLEEQRAASDRDIVRRRFLLFDCDPDRPSKTSSTVEEKVLAWSTAQALKAYLDSAGWPEPIVADSGNGYHLLYRVDLPGDDGGLIERVLRSVSERFTTDGCYVDTGVFNASRICKLYGTIARKGSETPERPHRRSRMLSAPANPEIVPLALLTQQADLASKVEEPKATGTRREPKEPKPERERVAKEPKPAKPPRVRKAQRDKPLLGTRTGDVERLFKSTQKRWPILRRHTRNPLMCKVVSYLIGRRYDDETTVAVAMRWHSVAYDPDRDSKDPTGSATSPAEHESEVREYIRRKRLDPDFQFASDWYDDAHRRATISPELSALLKSRTRPGLPGDQDPIGLGQESSPDSEAGASKEAAKITSPLCYGSPGIEEFPFLQLRKPLCRDRNEELYVGSKAVLVARSLARGEENVWLTDEQVAGVCEKWSGCRLTPRQVAGHKPKYVTRKSTANSPADRPATHCELLVEVRKGKPGVPSEYRPTALMIKLAKGVSFDRTASTGDAS